MFTINIISLILVIVGALNWGLWGFFQFDLVATICGGNTTGLARVIYSLVGLAGLWSLNFFGRAKFLGKGCCSNDHKDNQ